MLTAARGDEPAIAKSLFLGTLAGFRGLGVDVDPVLAKLGMTIPELELLPERLPPAAMFDLWQAARDVTGQTAFGVRLAERVRAHHFPTFVNVIAASATLGDALTRALRLYRLVSETVRFSAAFDARRAVLSVDTTYAGGRLHPEAVEFLLGSMTAMARRLTGGANGPGHGPREVLLRHDPPRDAALVERFFQCPVRFRALEDSIAFDSAILSLPVMGHDPERCASLQREAEAILDATAAPAAFQGEVATAISRVIAEGEPTIERVAERLGLHPKALSRRLAAEQVTYRQMLEDVRLRLARGYLGQQGLSVAEVAFRLGYSEKSAFNRAFKRWTGKAPDEYRHG